jgi:heme A synthase
MSRIRRLRIVAASLLAAFAALVAGSSAALASRPAPDPGGAVTPSSASVTITHGSPLWTFVVVAIIAVALTAAVMLLARRWRPANRSIAKAAFR